MNVTALRSALQERHMNQNDLAKAIGKSPTAVSFYLNGGPRGHMDPRLSTFKEICRVLDKKPEELW